MLPTTVVNLRSAEALKQVMADKGKSTRKLAAEAGCSPARIGQLISGEYQSTQVPIATGIASALDTKVADLFDFPDGEALIRLGLIRQVG